MEMEMFDPKSMKKRIGDMKKTETLNVLKEVEDYFIKKVKRYDFTASYDVMANEVPYFDTLNYTEYAHNLIIHPLNQELRMQQMIDAYYDNVPIIVDYVEFLRNKIVGNTANKYQEMSTDRPYEYRSNIVVLAGSNKLKDRICLNKLKYIATKFDGDVWFKPHPMTMHGLIGEMKDLFGEDKVLPRNANLYEFLQKADTVFTSHMSESVAYAVALGKQVEPIDVYNKVHQGSFYHIDKFLFTSKNPQEWLNRSFNSFKSGIINPVIDPNWKEKIDKYLEYIDGVKESYKNKFIAPPKKSTDVKPEPNV